MQAIRELRVRRFALRVGLRSLLAVAAVGATCWSTNRCLRAAPATFVFSAEVTSVFKSPSTFQLPIEIGVGDNIAGRLSFEPAPTGVIGTQNLGLRFDVGGLTLESPSYDLRIALNQFPPVGSIPFEPFDQIAISCSLLSNQAQCAPGTVPGSLDVAWRPFISLSAEPPFLSSFDLTGDVDVWNRFQRRSLELSFTSLHSEGLVRVSAMIGAMTAVPEPNSTINALWGIFMMIAFQSIRLRRRLRGHASEGYFAPEFD